MGLHILQMWYKWPSKKSPYMYMWFCQIWCYLFCFNFCLGFNLPFQVGTEISFKLPLSSSSSFESMFREIESCMNSVHNSDRSGNEDKYNLGIESYGISVTTLEEVFLRVAGCDFDETECSKQEKLHVLPDSVVSQASPNHAPKQIFHSKPLRKYKIIGVVSTIVERACSLIFAAVLSFINFFSVQCCSCCFISKSIFWEHSKALLIKRAIIARRDRKTIVFQLLIPAVFLLFGLLLLKLKPHPDQQSVTFTTSHFNPLLRGGGGGGPIPFDLSWPIAKEVSWCLLIPVGGGGGWGYKHIHD